jgi:hypothetical protein
MNLDRVRERLSQVEDKVVFPSAIVIHELIGNVPDPLPERFKDAFIAQPGETNAEVLVRYGIKSRKDKPMPIIRLGLKYGTRDY